MSVAEPESYGRDDDHGVSGVDAARDVHGRPWSKGRGQFESAHPLESLGDGIDLTPEFLERGESWSELDGDGNVVIRNRPPEERTT